MGIDFRIDDEPRYQLDGTLTDWREPRSFDGELLQYDELRGIFDDPPGQLDLHIQTVSQEPALPDDVVALDRRSPSWAYSGFARFRSRIAETIGVDLDMMEAYGSDMIIRRAYAKRVLGVTTDSWRVDLAVAKPWWEANSRCWSEIDSDLVPLLHHSDCDGDLSPEDCARVAPALRAAIKEIDEGEIDYDAINARELAEMMDACAKYGRRLVFC